MELQILKDGTRMTRRTVETVMFSLRTLLEENELGFYQLVMRCRDEQHQFLDKVREQLAAVNLVNSEGQIPEVIRRVVLVAVKGDGLKMTLGSPVEEQPLTASLVPRDTTRLEDYHFHCIVREVADRIVDISNKHGQWFRERRTEGPNPFYNQTATGLFIEHEYESFGTLWTPWGQWKFMHDFSGNADKAWREIVEFFGAAVHTPMQANSEGVFGPVHSITRFGDRSLPDAVLLARDGYRTYKETTDAWDRLSERFWAEHL